MKRSVFLPALALCALAAYMTGYAQGQTSRLPKIIRIALDAPFSNPQESFLEAVEILKRESYNSDLSDEVVYYAALKGVLRHLSPESDKDMLQVLYPELERAQSQQYSGDLASIGIGLDLAPAPNGYSYLIVSDIVPDTPAESSGLRLRDRIESIDGVNASRFNSLQEAESKLHDKPVGTIVKLVIARGKSSELHEFSVPAAKYRASWVRGRMIGGAGVIRIIKFGDGVQEDFRAAAKKLLRNKARGLVIDLRRTPGGVSDVATILACDFLGKGAVAYRLTDRKKDLQPVTCDKDGDTRTKLAVITDARTVSAAEILTSALKENGRARVVGTRTKGYAVEKYVVHLKNKFAFTYVGGILSGPKEDTWLGRGIAPDREIPLDGGIVLDAQLEADPAAVLSKDLQLKEALAALGS